MNFKDAEILSTYLDGRLSAGEAARREARLAVDAGMRQVLDDLRVARGLLKRTPRRKAPRNFTLRPTDARVLAPRPMAVPVLRYAGALASVLFLLSLATNSLVPTLSRSLAAAPAAIGMGGGGGGPDESPEAFAAVPQAPAAEEPAAPQDSASATMEAQAKTSQPDAAATPPAEDVAARGASALPIPSVWVEGLAAAAILAVVTARLIDRQSRRNFRSRFLEK